MMGIIVILMAIGISAGRFALKRSSIIQHQSAVDDIYRALLNFKNEEGYYPRVGTCSSCVEEQLLAEVMGYKGEKFYLENYIDGGDFDGGTDATYYYHADPVDGQLVVVCVSLGGIDDDAGWGYYCAGDGIGFLPEGDPVNDKEIGSAEDDPSQVNVIRGMDASDWHKDDGFASGN